MIMSEQIKNADYDALSEMKAWFFKESIRINEEWDLLDRERKNFSREQQLFDKKLSILKEELYSLANEKKKLEHEKILLQQMQSRARQQVHSNVQVDSGMFFKGVGNELALKKRYKELIKIYHPDNLSGDTETIQCINKEYNLLKKQYCG